jgi:hypothetical protein
VLTVRFISGSSWSAILVEGLRERGDVCAEFEGSGRTLLGDPWGDTLVFVVTIVLPMCRVVSEQDLLPLTDKWLRGRNNGLQLGTVLIGAVVAAGLGMKPLLLEPGQRKMIKKTFAGLGDILSAGIQPPGKTRSNLALLYLVVYVLLTLATWVIWFGWHDSATPDAHIFPAQLEDFKYDSVALLAPASVTTVLRRSLGGGGGGCRVGS